MQHDEGRINELWASQIIDHLASLGVSYFCVAPGSRCSSLILAAANHPDVEVVMHFDERGVGFHALGYGKAALKPAAVVVTSGTAIGNLLPAVMEASMARIPMILLTADRPPELRDVGANQTADQVKIFGNYVRWHVDLPCPEERLPENYLASTLSYAVFKSLQSPTGPIQINCMLREPLHSSLPDMPKPERKELPRYVPSMATCSQAAMQELADKLSHSTCGVIVVGSLTDTPEAKAIVELAKVMRWPLICDITAQARSFAKETPYIPHFDLLIKSIPDAQVDCVLHFGDRIVSKALAEWLSKQEPDYYLVADHPDRYDPQWQIRHRLHCNIPWFCQEMASLVNVKESLHLPVWKGQSQQIKEELADLLSTYEPLSEPGVFYHLGQFIPKDWHLFLANSMPVRDADNFFYPEDFTGKIYVNRGISGIDGNISTAAGLAGAIKSPLLAIIGDLTFLHDMNGIVQLLKSPTPIILLVINNGGGGIFSFLSMQKKNHAEELISAAHEHQFEDIAKFAGMEFKQIIQSDDFIKTLEDLSRNPRSYFIEVITDREENLLLHKEISKAIHNILCSQSELMAH